MKLTDNPIPVSSFGTIENRQDMLNKKTLRDYLCFGTLATVLFVVSDFVPLYVRWEAVQRTHWYFVVLLAAISAVILDLPMFLAGRTIREYQDGLRERRSMLSIVVPAVLAFFIAYVPFVVFSIATKEATFEQARPIGAASDFLSTSDVSNPLSVSVAAIFSAVLPLGTSIASLVVGLCTYNPVQERLQKLEKVKLLAMEHKSTLLWGIAQVSDRIALLKAREEDLFENFKDSVYAQEQVRIQAYEEALEEALDAEGILRTTDNAFAYLNNSGFSDDSDSETADAITDPIVEASREIANLTIMESPVSDGIA